MTYRNRLSDDYGRSPSYGSDRSTFPSELGINTYSYSIFSRNERKLSGLVRNFYQRSIKFEIISNVRRGDYRYITYEVLN